METQVDGSVKVHDVPGIDTDYPTTDYATLELPVSSAATASLLNVDEPRPHQQSIIARDLPIDVLLQIFCYYLWDHASEGSFRKKASYDVLHDRRPLFKPTCSRTGFPILPLPFGAQPLIHLSSVCALWRSTLLSTPSLYSKIVMLFQRPGVSSPRRLTTARIRRRTNLCRLMLTRSAPEPVSFVIVADIGEADPWAGDGRMGLAHLIKECGEQRERWREVEIVELGDSSLFNMLFYGGDGDEGCWYRTQSPNCGPAIATESDDMSKESTESLILPLFLPTTPLRLAPQLEKLSVHLEGVLDDTPRSPSTLQWKLVGRTRLGLTLGMVIGFIHGIRDAYPELMHFDLTIHNMRDTGVEPILTALKVLLNGQDSDDMGSERLSGERVPTSAETYEAFRQSLLATMHERIQQIEERRPPRYLGVLRELRVEMVLKRSGNGVIDLERVEGSTIVSPQAIGCCCCL